MPISPVSVVVGTTIATAIVVIGTGYAFKKFVYDPHLSHHIEALIAQHNQHQHHSNEPIPVPVQNEHVNTKGSSTSYQDHHTTLRKRNTNTRLNTNDENGLYELRERSSGIVDQNEYQGGASIYEIDESRVNLLDNENGNGNGNGTSEIGKLIDLEERNNQIRSESPQEREIKEVIFKLTPSSTPLRSGTSTPASNSNSNSASTSGFPNFMVNPFVSPEDDYNSIGQLPSFNSGPSSINQDQLNPPPPAVSGSGSGSVDPRTSSTSFSFLSLSQASSPEQINHDLKPSQEPSNLYNGFELEEEGTPTIGDDEEEIISNSTSNVTDFEDAESYTPISRSLSRTSDSHSNHNNTDIIGEMGLTYIPVPVPVTRGPLSVISIDGEELELSENEWDVISEASR